MIINIAYKGKKGFFSMVDHFGGKGSGWTVRLYELDSLEVAKQRTLYDGVKARKIAARYSVTGEVPRYWHKPHVRRG